LKNEFLIPPGFKDNVNFEAYIEHEYKNNIISYFRSYGFDLIKTPLIDYIDDHVKNNFIISTKKNEEGLKIRNDITPQIIRVVRSRLKGKNRPLKLCYYGEVARKFGTMLRPERQFLQVGAETIGSNKIDADIEIIDLAYKALSNIGIKNITIELSSKVFLDQFFKKISDSQLILKLKKLIKSKDINKSLNLLSDENDKNYLLNIFNCSGNLMLIDKYLSNFSTDQITNKEVKNLKTIISKIRLKTADQIIIDLTEIEEKKYHDGIKFTFFAKNVRGEIASGGRYSIKYNNHYETATGFTTFMDTVLRASSFDNLEKKILLPKNTNNKIKNYLVNNGFTLFVLFEEIKDIESEAKNFGCSHYFENNKAKEI